MKHLLISTKVLNLVLHLESYWNISCKITHSCGNLAGLLPDLLCGPVVRVAGSRSTGLGFDPRRQQIFWEVVALELEPVSLVRIIDELDERKSSSSGLGNRV
jgi:hypothetical protein